MVQSRPMLALVLLGVLLGSGNVVAQTPEYSSRGDKALVKSMTEGDYAPAVAAFQSATQGRKGKTWCTDSFFLGFALYMSTRYTEATAVFDDLFNNAEKLNCATNGLIPAWHYYRGLAYLQSGRDQESAASLATAVKLAPTAIPADFWPDWGFRTFLPTKAEFYQFLGIAQERQGTYLEAVGSYQKAIEFKPQLGYLYSGLGRAQARLGQYDEALPAAKRGVELQPDGLSYGVLGYVHAGRKHYGEAIAAYRKSIEIDPKNHYVYAELGKVLLATDDHDGAIAAYTKAAELAPTEPSTPASIGSAHALAGRFDQAIASFTKAINLVTYVGVGLQIRMENGQPVVQRQVEGDPGLIDGPAKEAGLKAGDKLIMIGAQPTKGWDAGKVVQVLRGQEHSQVVVSIERQGEAKPFEKAIIRRVIVSKEGSDLYGSRSLCARETGDREGASRDAQMAYALDSDNVAAREALAAVKLDGGKYQESITLLAPLKDDPFATILQATAYAKQGDAKLAVDTYARIPEEELLAKRALRQNAKKALLQALQGYVQQRLDHARVSEAAGSFVEALTDYADAMKIADDATADLIRQRVAATLKGHAYLTELPEEARKHAVRGDVLIKEGNFANALTEYQAAVKLAPFNAQLHFNTALIHGQLKDFRKAIKAMNVYLQLNPDASNMRAAKDEIYRWELALEREGKK